MILENINPGMYRRLSHAGGQPKSERKQPNEFVHEKVPTGNGRQRFIYKV
jgi:hypothetical protein